MSKPREKEPQREAPKPERPKRRGEPYPVDDPRFGNPDRHPGAEPDYQPGSSPADKPQL